MSLIIPENITSEVRNLALQIDDKLDALEKGVQQALTDEPAARSVATQTFSAQGGMQPTFNYSNPVVNVVSFLDPLWQQLRANEVALREVRIDSVENIHLKANSVTARNLRADSVTADKISVNELSAIVADIGTITAGNLTIDTSGFIRGGATAYNSGAGFWMGYDTTAYKFFIGDSAGNKLLFDGTNLTITGSITATTGTIGGWVIGADYIRGSDNQNGLYSGTGNVVRFWSGETFANRTTAPFRVYTDGTFVATNALITGTITSSSGTIGGFTLSSTTLSAGAGLNYISLSSAGSLTIGTTGYTSSSISGAGVAMLNTAGGGVANLGVTAGDHGIITIYNASSVQVMAFDGGTGKITFTSDTNIYRSGANTLATDDSMEVWGTSLYVNGAIRIDGAVRFGTRTAIGAETVTGYITITDSGGTSRKLAVVS